ncbi:TonB-dependent receptor, partial [candidate division KSB1 bacterium]|nr:TonB-dependent receptor [candidate division KSB1 bacterium]NIS26268.1 TonB-dependent receptor [candidate division KSB1 bacterium]NIT73030.1 TonB-dependent receptor [candidate division KSB1 bacterium]NIU26917.1 TonB-dependent receptor [candidate division KSB1 bacterium]NIU89991.1 TonB-dependent receptor [candidate division KSB1 bacterium]
PFNPSNPAESVAFLRNDETVYRTLGSVKVNWDLIKTERQALEFILQGGVDFFSMENSIFSPNELQFERETDLPGESVNGATESVFTNLYLHVTHNYNTPGNIMFRTTAGAQFEDRDVNNVLVNSNGLVQTQSNVDQAVSVDVFQTQIIQRERGFFVQEEINLQDKIYLTAALRGDASSTSGDTDKFFLFPKFSGSIRLSEYPFWEGLSGISDEFKFRVAYGETGNLPRPVAKFTNLIPSNIGGLSGLVAAGRRGDPDIEPERTREIELGFDATLFDEIAILELTYYRQDISDLILQVDEAPSSGVTSSEFNAGEMETTGWEISLGLNPIRKKNLTWTSRINFFTTDSEITELGVNPFTGLPIDPFNIGGFAT